MDERMVVFHKQIPPIKRKHMQEVENEKMSIMPKNKPYQGQGIVCWQEKETGEILKAIDRWMVKELQICSLQTSFIKCIQEIKMPRLTTLWMENCQLSSVEGLSWVSIPCLRKLYIKNNNIRLITDLRKLNCQCLRYINLSNNCILEWSTLTELTSSCVTGLTLHNDDKEKRQCEGLEWVGKLNFPLKSIRTCACQPRM